MYINDNMNPFDIRNFTDELTHVKGEKYICPVCDNNNLSISKKNGAYQCWNGCQSKDIREAIAPRETNTKPVRPAGKSVFLYDDREGNHCVKVTRIDDGKGHKDFPQSAWDGKKWQSNLDGLDRSKIPCYRYQEVRAAIAQGNPIFICEGEGVADALWELGIAATTFIGGSGNYRKYGSYKQDLSGAKLVLCPDRDEPGLAYMEEVLEDFPNAQWCYAPPSEFFWSHLPKNRGLDIKDWIAGGATAVQILEAVGERKSFVKVSAKVVTHPSFISQPDIKDIGKDIDGLIAQDLRRSQLLIAISELAQKYKMAENAIQKIYNTRVEELEREEARGDVKAEIQSLLAAQKSSIKLSEIFPEKLAKPIERLASILNLKPECFAIALLTQASALLKVGTETMLYPQSDYYCTPNYFGAIVAEVSQKKSPILRAMISRPMLPLLRAAREEYREKLEEYELKLVEWKANKKERNGPEPIKPRKRVYSFSKATGESIPYQVEHFPYQPLMYRCDELAGLLKSSNQYRGGKGSDDEDLLEYWNGGSTGTGVLRSEGMKADLDNILLSIFGTIQPSILADFLSQGDGNGKFARFDFVVQPLAACELSMDMPNVDLTPMLSDLYWRIDSLPAVKFELSLEARRKFIAFYNNCEQRRVQEQDPAIAGMIGKMPEKVGKLATCIHTIHSLFESSELPTTIETDAVVAAIKFVKFTELQILSLRSEIGDRHELAPNLVRMIQILTRKGVATIRDIITGFSSRCRPTSSTVRQWFSELVQLGYCVPVESGKFKLSENCGSSGSFSSNPVPASDRAWFNSGANDPDLDHQPEKMIQMIQDDPGVDHVQTITQQSIQPNDPDDPQKNQNQKNAIDENASSVPVGAIKILNKKQKSVDVPVDVPVDVTEAIADTKSLEEGDKIVSPGGTELVEVDCEISPKWITLKLVKADKLMVKKGIPKARWAKDDVFVVTHKEFKEWADAMSLRVVRAQAIPETDNVQDEPNWQAGQKLKMLVSGQMQRDIVEFIGFHFTPEAVAMAIVNAS